MRKNGFVVVRGNGILDWIEAPLTIAQTRGAADPARRIAFRSFGRTILSPWPGAISL